MTLTINDLDAIVGYDPNTHSFAGLPTHGPRPQSQIPTADRRIENTALALPKMGASIALGANPNTQYEMSPGKYDLNRAPITLPSVAARSQIPAAQSPDIRQDISSTGLPSMTAPQAPESIAKPKESAWQKIEGGLKGFGSALGNAVLGANTMEHIPGTQQNKEYEEARANRLAELKARTAETETGTEAKRAGMEQVPWTDQSGNQFMVPRAALPALEAAKEKAGATTGAAQIRASTALQIAGLKADSPEGKAKLASLGYKLGDDGNIVPIPDSEMSPQQKQRAQMNQSLIDLHEAQAEVEKSKNDPNSPQYKLAQQRLQFAQTNAQRMADALGLHQQEFENKLQEQQLVKPSGQTISRSDAAGAALAQLPGLENEIRNNAANLGPIMGRIKRGEIAIGNVDPKIAQLYSTLESFYSQQPAIHGFRNAEFVKDFDTFIGSLQTNPEATIAGLEGLRPTLEAVEKSGRTYRKRIVEGQPEGGAGAGGGGPRAIPQAGEVINGYRFKGGDYKDKNNWEKQ